ncbi:MAG: transposase [Legionellaceae bacterium]|nr:transposase [Legionellaceae bacterium]
MKIRKAFKFRLKTNEQQAEQLRQFAGCCRKVWNLTLAEQKKRLDEGLPCERYESFCKTLTSWKQTEELAWLNDSPASALQQKLKDLGKALRDAFDKKQPLKRFPNFKKRGMGDSFRIPQPSQFKLEGNRIQLPKVGWLNYFNSRVIEGTPKQVTVTESSGHWYVSVQTEIDIDKPLHSSSRDIGIDMGVSKLFAYSNGEHQEPVNSFKTHQKRLASLQRRLSKKKKFSEGWKKQKRKISRLHSKIACCRRDYLHKSTTEISKNHAMVAIEDLQIKNMSSSAKGNAEKPGKNVRAKSGLNRSILDQGWFEARRQLEYKQLWRGGVVVAVAPQYTSQTCSSCGHIDKQSRVSQSKFCCVSCGYHENADTNAAKNILAAGHAVLAGGAGPLGAAMKPEPLAA